MKYGTPNCPTCGRELIGEVDYTPGTASLFEREDEAEKATAATVFDYSGETDMHWDGQMNFNEVAAMMLRLWGHRDDAEKIEGLTRVRCYEDHEWDTTKEDA